MSFLHRLFTAENHKKQSVSIAFLDTGISPVADFITPENRIIAFRDLVGGRSEPYDDNGHGTHVTIPKHVSSLRKPTNAKNHPDSQAIGMVFYCFLWFSTLFIRLQTA